MGAIANMDSRPAVVVAGLSVPASLPRRLPAVLALIAIVALSACSAAQGSGVAGTSPTPEPTSTPSSTPTPDPTCPTESTGERLVDTRSGFEMVMPANWRNLRPGDPGWVTVYGGHNSTTEREVAENSIQDFAAPVAPQDPDTMTNLAVYVDPVTSQDLTSAGAEYARVIESMAGKASAPELVSLPAGAAVKVTGTYPHGNGGFDDRVVGYLMFRGFLGTVRYALIFVSRDSWGDHYGPIFQCMAESFRYVSISPSPSAS